MAISFYTKRVYFISKISGFCSSHNSLTDRQGIIMLKFYSTLFTIILLFYLFPEVKPQVVQKTTARMDINNINALEANNGFSDYNLNLTLEGLEFPKGSKKTAIYTSGFLWGGFVKGDSQVRVGGSSYRSGLQPGPIINGVGANPTDPKYSIYRVRPDIYPAGPEVDLTNDTALEGISESVLRAQYISDWENWPAAGTANDLGAPFKDVNADGKYEPGIDIPGVPGADQTIYYVANDLDSTLTNNLYATKPLGIELHATYWAYAMSGPLNNVYFKKWTLINKGANTIDSMFVSFWADADLGFMSDDLLGCDSTLGLSYTYNSNSTDSGYYPLPPPAVGFSLFQGPIVKGASSDFAILNGREIYGKKNLSMTAAYAIIYMISFDDPPPITDPYWSTYFYRMFNGEYGATGSPVLDNNGNQTKFYFYGDPVARTGWIDGVTIAPGDRVQGLASGPFTFAPNDTQEVVVAEIFAGSVQGVTNLQAVSLLKKYDKIIHNYYNVFFDIPSAVENPGKTIKEFSLSQNYPNPFNPSTTINYSIPKAGFITLKVFDVLGREVSELVSGEKPAGNYKIIFNAAGFGSGVYFYRLMTGNSVITKKLIVVK